MFQLKCSANLGFSIIASIENRLIAVWGPFEGEMLMNEDTRTFFSRCSKNYVKVSWFDNWQETCRFFSVLNRIRWILWFESVLFESMNSIHCVESRNFDTLNINCHVWPQKCLSLNSFRNHVKRTINYKCVVITLIWRF